MVIICAVPLDIVLFIFFVISLKSLKLNLYNKLQVFLQHIMC